MCGYGISKVPEGDKCEHNNGQVNRKNDPPWHVIAQEYLEKGFKFFYYFLHRLRYKECR